MPKTSASAKIAVGKREGLYAYTTFRSRPPSGGREWEEICHSRNERRGGYRHANRNSWVQYRKSGARPGFVRSLAASSSRSGIEDLKTLDRQDLIHASGSKTGEVERHIFEACIVKGRHDLSAKIRIEKSLDRVRIDLDLR